jgi:hypothetical protein
MCTATIAERPLTLCTGFAAFPMTSSGKSQTAQQQHAGLPELDT